MFQCFRKDKHAGRTFLFLFKTTCLNEEETIFSFYGSFKTYRVPKKSEGPRFVALGLLKSLTMKKIFFNTTHGYPNVL